MKRRLLILVAAVAVAVAGGSALVLPKDEPHPRAEQPVVEAETAPASISYVGETAEGPRVFTELHTVEVDELTNLGLGASNEAIAGTPVDPDYRSRWPSGSGVTSLSLVGPGTGWNRTVRIDLVGGKVDQRPADMSAEEARATLAALITTVEANFAASERFVFYRDGRRLRSVLGIDTSKTQPAAGGVWAAPVQIAGPAEGAVITAEDVAVLGSALTRDSGVIWELRNGDALFDSGRATAARCCQRSSFEFRIKDVPSGRYTLVIRSVGPSGAEFEDSKTIVIDRQDGTET